MNLLDLFKKINIFLYELRVRFPDRPNREYWVCEGYEPYSWTVKDIEAAKQAGWTNIVTQEVDRYPYLKGTVHGIDPNTRLGFYLPKKE